MFSQQAVQNIPFVLGTQSPGRLFIMDQGKVPGYLEVTLAHKVGRSSVTWLVELQISVLYAKGLDLQK